VQKPLPNLLNPLLASALSHPTRLHVMKILFEKTATPAELAAELDIAINNVSYHINQLVKLGCVELASERPAGGGRVVEHLYRATRRAYFDGPAWGQLGPKEKLDVATAIMRLINEDVAEALSSGTFFDPDDNHISRSPMTVDSEGWGETIALLDKTVDGLMEIEENVAGRSAGDSEIQTFPIKVEIIQFRSPTKS
jgi:DNA-binding transcriptional ArsR family regulator